MDETSETSPTDSTQAEATEPNLEKPFQFTIGQLMIVTAAVAIFLAIVTQLSPAVSILVAIPYLSLVFLGLVLWSRKAQKIYNRGLSLHQNGDYDEAIVAYTEAIRMKPNFANAYNNRGNAWLEKGEYEKSIYDYTVALRLNPQDAAASYNRDQALNELALKHMSRIQTLNPNLET